MPNNNNLLQTLRASQATYRKIESQIADLAVGGVAGAESYLAELQGNLADAADAALEAFYELDQSLSQAGELPSDWKGST